MYVRRQLYLKLNKWKSRVLTHVPKAVHRKNLNLNLETET